MSPRTCSRCGRPLGIRARRCLYCGQAQEDDAPANEGAAAAADGVDSGSKDAPATDAERLRGLLDGLGPEARALLAYESRAAARASESEEPGHGPAMPSASPLGALRGAAFARLPSAVRRITDAVRRRHHAEAALPSLPGGSPPPNEMETLLRRGGGPLGSREAAARLFLLPDPAHRAGLPWLRHRLAQATGLDLYTAARLLQKDVPACLEAGSEDEVQVAEERLAGSGLRTFTWRYEPGTLPLPVECRTIHIEGGRYTASHADGEEQLRREDLILAVQGTLEPDREVIPFQPERDRWGRFQPVEARTLVEGALATEVVDLIRRVGPPLRIRADRFDFRGLGEERTLSARKNLVLLVDHLGPPPVPRDGAFRHLGHVSGPPNQGGPSRREVEFTEYVLLLRAAAVGAG